MMPREPGSEFWQVPLESNTFRVIHVIASEGDIEKLKLKETARLKLNVHVAPSIRPDEFHLAIGARKSSRLYLIWR